ncbi:MAG TPA: 5'-nucleotidase C-terminal domain-containing protein [Candidatus Eisenbacteria bacterium]|jgi:2',3'-cyclic-nucleotide 2'-phosphodiesterase/3'-nucleotidase
MRAPRLVAAFALALVLAGRARAEEAHLVVLHTTDLHGALTPWDYLADRPAVRGLTKIASLVHAVREEGAPLLLLDAGDCIQGGIEFGREGGAQPRTGSDPMMAAMNRMGYDAMAVGNHEFDFGLGEFEQARSAAAFPWLAANIVRAGDGKPAFGASIVSTLGGVRVGVVGLCTPAVPFLADTGYGSGLRVLPPVEVARREVGRLRAEGRCDVVVLLAHTGLERDPESGAERPGAMPDEHWGYRLATEVPGTDLVILGHSHALVPSQRVGGTLVVQAGKWAQNLGRVDLTLTRAGAGERWKLSSAVGRAIAVTDSVPEDAEVAALAAPYHAAARAALAETLGTAAREIGAPRGRFDDGPLWELIQNAQLDASGAEVSLASLADPAATIGPGPVTRRDLLRACVYQNRLVVLELTGEQLRQTLEQGAGTLAPYGYESDHALLSPGGPADRLDAAEGVGYELDLTRAPGDRVRNLVFRGEPLSPERRLKVAVSDYRASGGGAADLLRAAPRVWRSAGTIPEILADYVRGRTLNGAFTRNWTLLPLYERTAERPLIDRLVRLGAAPAAELMRLDPDEPARRGDLLYWLARAFDWRSQRRSSAFPDVPDSLEPWLDGLLQHRVLGDVAALERVRPFGIAPLSLALDWCERAARAARYSLPSTFRDGSFRMGLMTGVALGPAARAFRQDTLTRAQLLGLVANLRFPALRVLETTDFHGAILPGAVERRTRRAIGGSAVLAAHLARLRAENPEGTVLIDGGDLFQGTMTSNLQFGRPVVEQMNALGYAATAIGNHEFDWGVDTLEHRMRELRCAALGANMLQRRDGKRPRWARADTAFDRRGVRVGVLGLCYRYTPSVTLSANVAHLRFEDDSTTAARLVPRLRRREQADVVLVVGHIPADSDSLRHAQRGDLVRMARGVRGVDAWFGGHSHNQVLDAVGGVPLMIAGSQGQVIGVCDLVVDPVAHRVVERSSRLVTTYADEVVPDSAMAARVARWNANVAPLAAVPVGRLARGLGRGRGESTVGDLVCDAIREASGVDVAFQNSGGLRADLAEGVVTKGAVYEVMPFENTIFTLELSGAEVRRALEDALGGGRVTQVSGIRYEYDPGRPRRDRVVSVTLADGSPLEESKLYKVACNNFMATGGDDNAALSGGRNRTDTGRSIREALEAYIAARSKDGATLDYRPDGRIRLRGASGGDAGER